MITKRTAARDALRSLSGADEHERDIDGATTEVALTAIVRKYWRNARARSIDLAEAWFWLGKAVAKAKAFAYWGDRPIEGMAARMEIPVDMLRSALGFHDVFLGEYEAMHAWATGWLEANGSIHNADMKRLAKANKNRRTVSQSADRWRASIDRSKRYMSTEDHGLSKNKVDEAIAKIAKEVPIVDAPRPVRRISAVERAARDLARTCLARTNSVESAIEQRTLKNDDEAEYVVTVTITRLPQWVTENGS